MQDGLAILLLLLLQKIKQKVFYLSNNYLTFLGNQLLVYMYTAFCHNNFDMCNIYVTSISMLFTGYQQ